MKKIWGKSTIIFQERRLKAVKRIVNLSKGFGNKKRGCLDYETASAYLTKTII